MRAACCQSERTEDSEDVKPPAKVAVSDCEMKLEKKWEAIQKKGADYVRGMLYRYLYVGCQFIDIC